MSDDSMAVFGNTTKGGHRGPSELMFRCRNPKCRVPIAQYPCPHCRYEPGMLDRESAPPQSPPLELLWDTVDGEIILRVKLWRCDHCGKQVERFRHRIYAEEFFRISPQLCQQCQDKNARR